MNNALLQDAIVAVCDLIEAQIGTNDPHLAKVRKAVGKVYEADKAKGKKAKEAKGVAK
jgi:carbamate kinase